jgi:hypothetical protein
VNVWHFAHEAGQEREDCLVGALNLLRRLAVEHLKAEPLIRLPAYQVEVAVAFPNRVARKTIEWEAQPVSADWRDEPAQDAAVARLLLDSDAVADLFVDVGDEMPSRRVSPSSPAGVIAYFVPLPPIEALRSEASAKTHIARSGRLAWVHQPDSYGLIADVRGYLETEAAAERTAWDRRIQREREQFEAQRARALSTARSIQGTIPPVALKPSMPGQVEPEIVPAWAKLRNPVRGFFGYRYASRGAWVLFEMKDQRGAARRLVDEQRVYWLDGVEDSLLAQYDADLDLVVFSSLSEAQITMATERVTGTCITSSLSEIRQKLREN